MKITADTNVLVRCVVRDDEKQAKAADKILKKATLIAVPLPVLCEFVWVLRKVYDFGLDDVANAVRALLDIPTVATHTAAAEAGLALLEAGGDFADAAIAEEGHQLGGERFVSFDKKAVTLLEQHGVPAVLLAS